MTMQTRIQLYYIHSTIKRFNIYKDIIHKLMTYSWHIVNYLLMNYNLSKNKTYDVKHIGRETKLTEKKQNNIPERKPAD